MSNARSSCSEAAKNGLHTDLLLQLQLFGQLQLGSQGRKRCLVDRCHTIRGSILREQGGSRQILVLMATPDDPQSLRSQVWWQVCTLVSLEEPLQLHAIPAENLTHLLVVHLTILWIANLDGRADTDAEMRLVGQEGQTPPPETERNPDVELLPQTPRSCTGPLWHIIELILSEVVGWNKRHAMLDRLPHEAKLGWKEDLLLLRVGLQLLVDTSRADEDRPP
mmetsp:Transcript_81079/g.262039  ORF Transcript_81079/g.262039 Transcript_81079/m.262039 type:complete len:222 (+) Transcript_81079:289-954(+)